MLNIMYNILKSYFQIADSDNRLIRRGETEKGGPKRSGAMSSMHVQMLPLDARKVYEIYQPKRVHCLCNQKYKFLCFR